MTPPDRVIGRISGSQPAGLFFLLLRIAQFQGRAYPGLFSSALAPACTPAGLSPGVGGHLLLILAKLRLAETKSTRELEWDQE